MATKVKTEIRAKPILSDLEKKLRDRVRGAAQLVRNDVVLSLNRSQPSKRVGSRLVGLEPSKEGEAPKRLTNSLIKSIQVRVQRRSGSIAGVIGTRLVYARRLELGFMGRDSLGRMITQGPRPFLRPALKRNAEKIRRLLTRR